MTDAPLPAHLGRADLHLHTLASDGLMSAEALVDYVERQTSFDVIAVTDHDEVEAGLEARESAARRNLRVQVIPGVEVTTRQGHLIALFLEERPPAFRSYAETAEWIRRHGGVCIAPHPFTRWTHSVSLKVLTHAVERDLIGGVEVFNASPAGRASQAHAFKFAAGHRVASVGSSDAHMLRGVGLAYTTFPGNTPNDLRMALLNHTTGVDGRFVRIREVASEVIPQLARSMVHLPIRRVVRRRLMVRYPALAQRLLRATGSGDR